MEVAQELTAKRAEENSRQLRSRELPSWQERVAWLLLCGVLVGVGLYILANYLRALAWALVLAIAIWPSMIVFVGKRRLWWPKRFCPFCSPRLSASQYF
jgi:predicted PurR-regulated permease PerM